MGHLFSGVVLHTTSLKQPLSPSFRVLLHPRDGFINFNDLSEVKPISIEVSQLRTSVFGPISEFILQIQSSNKMCVKSSC